MNEKDATGNWQAIEEERAEARHSTIFDCLGTNRVPESHPSSEDSNAVFERIDYIVSQSM